MAIEKRDATTYKMCTSSLIVGIVCLTSMNQRWCAHFMTHRALPPFANGVWMVSPWLKECTYTPRVFPLIY